MKLQADVLGELQSLEESTGAGEYTSKVVYLHCWEVGSENLIPLRVGLSPRLSECPSYWCPAFPRNRDSTARANQEEIGSIKD